MSAKRTKATIKPSPCNISGEMGEKISALLQECDIVPVNVPELVEDPLPLILPDEQNINQQDTEVEMGKKNVLALILLFFYVVFTEFVVNFYVKISVSTRFSRKLLFFSS